MTTKKRLGTVFFYGVAILLAVIALIPFLWMISTSFKSRGALMSIPIEWIPENPTWDAYIKVFSKFPFAKTIANSLFISVSYTAITLLSSAMAAFAFAKLRFTGSRVIFGGYLATMMIPTQVTMIPRYLMIQKLGLFNTVWALIVPGLVTGFSVYLARQFISDVPDSICEAAKIDGAGPFRIYWNIILPNIRPAIGSIGIFTAMMQWNDYLNPLLMLNDIEKMTMPLGLVIFNSQRTSDLAATMAAATMIMMPMILIFIIFQKQFIKGMTMSGIK